MSARRRKKGRGKLRRNGKGNAGGRKTEQIPRKVTLRETANAMTITLAYALTIIMFVTLAAAKEKTVTGQLSRKLLEFLINPAKLSIHTSNPDRRNSTTARHGQARTRTEKDDPTRSVTGGKSDRTPLIIVLRK